MKTIWTFPWPGSAVTTNTSIDCSQVAGLEMRGELRRIFSGLAFHEWKAKRWLDERNVRYGLRGIDVSPYGDELVGVSGG
jgi:hypothetical protein